MSWPGWESSSPIECLADPSSARHRSLADAKGPQLVRVPASPDAIDAACDFFSVVTVLFRRPYVLFFIELDSRRVDVTEVTANPTGSWVVQQVHNLCMVLADRTHPVRFLICDRDAKFTSSFDEVFQADGIKIIGHPVRAPRVNAYAERFVGTVRRGCPDRMPILGRCHLEQVLADYVAQYNEHRLHRALDQQAPTTVGQPLPMDDPESKHSYDEQTRSSV